MLDACSTMFYSKDHCCLYLSEKDLTLEKLSSNREGGIVVWRSIFPRLALPFMAFTEDVAQHFTKITTGRVAQPIQHTTLMTLPNSNFFDRKAIFQSKNK